MTPSAGALARAQHLATLPQAVRDAIASWPDWAYGVTTPEVRAATVAEALAALQRIAQAWGGECLSPAYVAQKHKLAFRCASGHEWQTIANRLRTGYWCPHCTPDRLIKDFAALHELARRHEVACVSDTYINGTTPLTWRCRHGHVWQSSGAYMKRHFKGCPQCLKAKYAEDYLVRLRAYAAERGGRCLATVFVHATDKVQWQCAHGHTWFAVPARTWCPECTRLTRMVVNHPVVIPDARANARFEDARQLAAQSRGVDARALAEQARLDDAQALAAQHGGTCLSVSYVGSNDPLRWQCAQGHEWQSSLRAQRHRLHWCEACANVAAKREALADMHRRAAQHGRRWDISLQSPLSIQNGLATRP
ncbi:hypothetical protein [Silvimonas sp.]|uniref:hypothetical protein n=1 Tax=Silvimonas sp. TaxID=2650811 RepID=UPI00284CD32C|nr:hypothetical protein [Silvimonas sp.]MDR3428204.1 hypothetical protein [Silvimonas sp.]